MAARLPAALLVALLLAAAAPAALANSDTVRGSIFCDVDKSGTVNAPPDTPAVGAQVKIVCITGPTTTSTHYAVTDVNGAYIFNKTIPTVNSTGPGFGGCIATLVKSPDTTCALPGPCNSGDKGEPILNATGGSLTFSIDHTNIELCFPLAFIVVDLNWHQGRKARQSANMYVLCASTAVRVQGQGTAEQTQLCQQVGRISTTK
eukprot:SM000174S03361  [mRNA]  locus=s174:94750:95815:- [translate_table: standard]